MTRTLAIAGAALALLGAPPAATPGENAPELPRTLAWTAYNLGTTGYNQSVAIGKMLKDRYDVTLRVIPGKNDVSRLLPLVRDRVHFSANGVATYFAQEGVFQFAHPDWGPQRLRLLITSNGDSNQALAVAADTGIERFAELEGRPVPWVRGAPALNVSTEAFLACGGLGWENVRKVEFPGYGAMWNGIVAGQVDAAYATTVSGPTRKLEASPRGIAWPTVPHDDEACWRRLLAVAPYFTRHVATRGAGIWEASPHEGATYPYPLLIAKADQDPALVYALTRAIAENYDAFKDADPGAIGWAPERQVFDWVVPWHEAAVRYWREAGAWSDRLEAHNRRLVRRQRVLADAWAEVERLGIDDERRFRETWARLRRLRLEEAGFDPIWR